MSHYTRRGCIGLGLSMAATFAARAQTYPSKATTIVAPFAPGASADGIARIVARGMAATLGQPVVVENKPGAGGATGLLTMANMPPDGYTLGIGATGAIAVNPHLPDAAPLKPQKDLLPLAKLADIPLVLVAGAKSGFDSLPQLLEKARNTPDGINFGTSGQYTSQHLAGELLANLARIRLLAVPYRGSGPAITDLLGGQLPLAVVDLTSAYPHIKSGALKALGVTSATRSKVAPEIPTIAEGGVPGYSAPAWMGLFGPAGMADPVARKVMQAVETLMAKPDVQQQILSLAAEPSFQDGPAFARFIRSESDKWAEIIRKIPKPAK